MAKRQHFSNIDDDFYPNKSQKLITTNFNDLPDEIQLKIFNYLTIKELIQCGQVSKRTRRISLNSTVCQKVNLHKKYVPPKFIKFILDHGCQYLDLSSSRIVRGDLQLNGKIYNLKYLNLGDCNAADADGLIEELIFSCPLIQKLSLKKITLLAPRLVKKILMIC